MLFSKVCALMGLFFVTFLCAQESGEQIPFLLAPAQDTVPQWIRDARAKAFNVRGGRSMLEPTRDVPPGAPPPPPPFSSVTFATQAEMPYADADSVVVGTISHLQPFLSADKNGIYTEYTLTVTETVKNRASTTVLPGDSLTLVRPGGAARLTDGRVVRHSIVNDIIPAVGRQYLAFLLYQFDLDSFAYVKLWLVEGGVLKPLFPDDLARKHHGKSEYAGKPLQEVIFSLKDVANR